MGIYWVYHPLLKGSNRLGLYKQLTVPHPKKALPTMSLWSLRDVGGCCFHRIGKVGGQSFLGVRFKLGTIAYIRFIKVSDKNMLSHFCSKFEWSIDLAKVQGWDFLVQKMPQKLEKKDVCRHFGDFNSETIWVQTGSFSPSSEVKHVLRKSSKNTTH